jgi:hypothetical protein
MSASAGYGHHAWHSGEPAPGIRFLLLDHLVCRGQQRFRDGEAEGLSGREIDDQINFAPSGDFLSKRLSLDRFSDR